ncbi:MAG: hypothetical protein E6699_04285, partial [Bradyrhizobium sp.]|uniref:hypothetical protein n=1 Tax=Bradyrhizobium sp. TaxID=376 RepID=UPI002904823E
MIDKNEPERETSAGVEAQIAAISCRVDRARRRANQTTIIDVQGAPRLMSRIGICDVDFPPTAISTQQPPSGLRTFASNRRTPDGDPEPEDFQPLILAASLQPLTISSRPRIA